MSLDIRSRLDAVLGDQDTAIRRDLKLNLQRLLEESSLAGVEGYLAFLASARAAGSDELAEAARQGLAGFDLTQDQVQEAEESAAIMAMLNTYYRFKHMVQKDEDYRVAGLRMTSLAKPALGKERFEMLALAVSAINGCESCIRAHEKALRDSGVPVEKVHDLARIAAVTRGLATLKRS